MSKPHDSIGGVVEGGVGREPERSEVEAERHGDGE